MSLDSFLESISMSKDALQMVCDIFVVLILALLTVFFLLERRNERKIGPISSSFLDLCLPPISNPHKRDFEIFCLKYSCIWITGFGVIIATGVYEKFDEWGYMIVCVGFCLPFLLYPLILTPHLPLQDNYALKANLWIGVYSFIGNYWYTHYFYSVLKANYSFPSWWEIFIVFCFWSHFTILPSHSPSHHLISSLIYEI